MKMIMAVIKPFKLDDVRESLLAHGVEGMTISEVQGCGRQKGQTDTPDGGSYSVNFLPKLKLEIAVADDQVDKVVEALQNSANTGRIGDGKIFVYDLEQIFRIRTGESGEDAV